MGQGWGDGGVVSRDFAWEEKESERGSERGREGKSRAEGRKKGGGAEERARGRWIGCCLAGREMLSKECLTSELEDIMLTCI